jgi:hypothetical protein
VTLGEAGGWNWDDERKIDTLRPCISDYLKRKLQEHDVAGTTPAKYLDFVSLCKRYASQSSGTTTNLAPGTAPSLNRQLYDYKADKMDLSNVNVIGTINAPPSLRSGTAPNPTRQLYDHKADKMDLSAINIIGTIDSPSRSGSRSSSHSSIDRSHCYRCGATDHYVSVCPVPRPGSPPKQVRPIPVSQGRPGRKQMGRRDRLVRDDLE